MNRHVLVMSIGPIQEFIKSARRTRDLWFGSNMLSEISREVALAAAKNGVELIFPPYAASDAELTGVKEVSVANVIIGIVPEGSSPEVIATRCRKAAHDKWNAFATGVLEEIADIEDKYDVQLIDRSWFLEQLDDVIEFYAAWAAMGASAAYPAARQAAMRILGARKTLRDFKPWKGRWNTKKSSLDGRRESVLRPDAFDVLKDDKIPQRFRFKMRLGKGETLDSIGLVKRMCLEQPYPSTHRVAVQPWIESLQKTSTTTFNHLSNIKASLDHIRQNISKELIKYLSPDAFPQYKDFPYEAEFLFPEEQDFMDLLERFSDDKKYPDAIKTELLNIKSAAEALHRHAEFPHEPYYAVLQADGDRMGKTISDLGQIALNEDGRALDIIEKNRRFSKRLAEFALTAREIIEAHSGCSVYTGGDDVLAFLPLHTCLDCAREVHDAFGEALKEFSTQEGGPTLSVGIAIGHIKEPLEDMLNFAREAESDAKSPDRNGLAIHLHPHNGGAIKVRDRWDNDFFKRMKRWIASFNDGLLSDKTPYELRQAAQVYIGWDDEDQMKKALIEDVTRILKKKRPGGESMTDTEVEKIREIIQTAVESVPAGDDTDINTGLIRIAEEILIARRMALVVKQVL